MNLNCKKSLAEMARLFLQLHVQLRTDTAAIVSGTASPTHFQHLEIIPQRHIVGYAVP